MTNPDDMAAARAKQLHRKKILRDDLRQRMEGNIGQSGSVVKEIVKYLQDRPELRVVALFSALPGEVELEALLDKMERIWVFPKVEGEDLAFYQVKRVGRDLKIGKYGIFEPKAGLKRYEIPEIDLFLCPGLGFDLKGGRIGRGRGFYDRVLEKARNGAVKLGVCFRYQLVDEAEMEMEEHDIRMDGVIAG